MGQLIGDIDLDELLAVPQRMVYDMGDIFYRETDLSVFASYSGNLQPIPINDVTIKIIEDIHSPEDSIPVNGGGYWLAVPGRKIISVSYGSLAAEYSIEVKDPFGIGGGNGSGGNSGTSLGNGGSGIIWDYPGRPNP
ncbi:MAG: hypothetical protein FWG50_10620 [Kiritimatiellaeota bacterium]|nr:hypothetical protein [Kiritimatiellota bacterium]